MNDQEFREKAYDIIDNSTLLTVAVSLISSQMHLLTNEALLKLKQITDREVVKRKELGRVDS